MALPDLDTFFDPDLHLPIRGKVYRIPAPGYEGHERMRRACITDGLPPVEVTDLALEALGASRPIIEHEDGAIEHGGWVGGALDDMVADGVPWSMILHAGRTAILHFGFSPDWAETHWALAQLGRKVDLESVSTILGNATKGDR